MPARKLDFYLNTSDPLRSLAHAARELHDLQQILAKNTPSDLSKSCQVNKLRDGIVFLAAANAAIATQVRQLSPRLLNAFQKQVREVTSIRIDVQVTNPPPQPKPGREKSPLSIETIKNIQHLADELEDSPLKEALIRLTMQNRPDAGKGD
jgi:hypothetical protein